MQTVNNALAIFGRL